MAKGQRTQPDRTDACAPHEARRNLPDERAHESAIAAPPWLMREKGVVPARVAGGFNRSAPMQRIRPSDRQGTVLKARRVGGVRAPGFRSTVLDTSTPRRTLLRSRPALLCMHNKARPGEPGRGNPHDSRPPTQVVDLAPPPSRADRTPGPLDPSTRAGAPWRAEVRDASFSDARCAALMHDENEWTAARADPGAPVPGRNAESASGAVHLAAPCPFPGHAPSMWFVNIPVGRGGQVRPLLPVGFSSSGCSAGRPLRCSCPPATEAARPSGHGR